MSLRNKILAGFAAVLVMTAILGSTAIYLTSHMGSYSAEASIIDNARGAILAGEVAYVTFTSNEDDAFAQEALKQMDEAMKLLQAAHDMDSNASNRAGLAKAISVTQKLHTDISAMLDRQHEANALYARVTTDIDTLGADFTAVSARMQARALDALSARAIENMALLAAARNELAVSGRAGVQAFTMFSSDETRQELMTGMQKTLDNLVSLSERAEVPANRTALLDLRDKTATYIELAGQYLKAQGSVGVMQNAVSAEVASLLTQAEELSGIGIASVQNANNLANIVALALMIVALAAGIAIALYISGSVMRQLGADPGDLAAMATRVAAGDYDVDDGAPHHGVFDNLIKMVAILKQNIEAAHQQSEAARQESARATEAMEEARKAGEEAHAQRNAILAAADRLESVINVVSSASQELSAQIEQSGHGASEQAARVAETATAMDEMNTTVMEVARNAGHAAEFSANTRQKAEAGAEVVHNVVQSIQAVQAQSIHLKEDMGMLEQNAQSINQIMAVISDIADQTNLLALNAAIEAARAGEAGRGFAVVADSVRNLAEKTMASTTDVAATIKAIQDSAEKSVSQLDSAVATINEATSLATESGHTLEEIVNMAEQTADQVRAIAAASEEQSASSEEITRSIDQVSRISHETAEAMRQSSEAVAELARQAQELSTLVDEMKHA